MEIYFLHFESQTIAQDCLDRLREIDTKIQFRQKIEFSPDPNGNPLFLKSEIDYYTSWLFPEIARTLEVPIIVEQDGKIIETHEPMPTAAPSPTPAREQNVIGISTLIAAA